MVIVVEYGQAAADALFPSLNDYLGTSSEPIITRPRHNKVLFTRLASAVFSVSDQLIGIITRTEDRCGYYRPISLLSVSKRLYTLPADNSFSIKWIGILVHSIPRH